MYVKITGGILIIGSASALGYTLGLDLKKELEELLYIKQLILMLRGEIKYAKEPLSEAFLHISARVREPYCTWLSGLSDSLKRRSENTFLKVWTESIDNVLCQTVRKTGETEYLKALGRNMGYLDTEMQLRTIDLYLEQLEVRIQSRREEMAAKRRLLNCLGVLGGMFLFVVLI